MGSRNAFFGNVLLRHAVLGAAVLGVTFGSGCGGTVENPVFVKAEIRSQRFTLRNGLDVVLHPDAAAHDVVVNMRYDAGSKDDPRDKTGLAHFVEHLTFRRKPDGALDMFSHLENAGSYAHNAVTTSDYTEYYATVPPSELPLALWIEASRMAHPMGGLADGLDDIAFIKEQKVVANELRERVENVVYGHLDEAAIDGLFGAGHPYHWSPGGSEEHVELATRADATEFTSKHYRPNNATLVVAGAFDTARASALIRAYFDPIPAGKVAMATPIALPQPASQTITVETGTDAPALTVAWIVPPAGFRGWAEMKIAASELGGYVKYRMKSDARRVVPHLYSRNAASVLLVHVELAREGSVSDVLARIDEEIELMAEGEVTIGDSKARLIAEETLELESLEERASKLQDLVSRYDDPNAFQRELHAISAVTAASFQSAVGAFLRGPRVVAIAKPTPGAPKAGRRPE